MLFIIDATHGCGVLIQALRAEPILRFNDLAFPSPGHSERIFAINTLKLQYWLNHKERMNLSLKEADQEQWILFFWSFSPLVGSGPMDGPRRSCRTINPAVAVQWLEQTERKQFYGTNTTTTVLLVVCEQAIGYYYVVSGSVGCD